MKLSLILLLAIIPSQVPSKYKNIQVLKGMSDPEILKTMSLWSRQLGVNCPKCHVQGDFATDEIPAKRAARRMHQMVEAINEQEYFRTATRKVDCYMCHKGAILP